MNERPTPADAAAAAAAAEPWRLGANQQQQPLAGAADHHHQVSDQSPLQHHEQSPFAVHHPPGAAVGNGGNGGNNNGRNLHHHHLYPHQHHAPPRLVVKGGGAMANGVNELDVAQHQQQQQHYHHHHHHHHHHHVNNHHHHHSHSADGGPESDADEEVRSLDLPAQVGIDLRNKRTSGSAEALDRERPMSWEGELSDQEVSQMEHETNRLPNDEPSTASAAPSASAAAAAVAAVATLKTEPANEDDDDDADEHEMDGIQSVGPSSPQPMCTNAASDEGDARSASMPPPSSLALNSGAGVAAKHETPWNGVPETGALKADPSRPSPPLASTSAASVGAASAASGSTPTAPRPTFGDAFTGHTPLASPLTSRHPIRLPLTATGLPHPPTPSPDSAIHSAYYSPTASPGQSRHRSGSGLSSPYSHRASPSLSRNNSDASQYSVHSQYGGSQYSYSSAPSPLSPSPAQSPVQPRHVAMLSAAYGPRSGAASGPAGAEFPPSPLLYRHASSAPFPGATPAGSLPGVRDLEIKSEPGSSSSASHPSGSADIAADDSREGLADDGKGLSATDLAQHTASLAAQAGISRQQLINSPCPICGDKISGFHYGIFSCESCKGFFKRTVQNKKNYVCLRGAACPVTIATRKKCPACRFEKCLNTGMKLEAIREDRTRGGRSTYQCTYAVPSGSGPGVNGSGEASAASSGAAGAAKSGLLTPNSEGHSRSLDSSDWTPGGASTGASASSSGAPAHHHHHHHHASLQQHTLAPSGTSVPVPQLLLEIMNVEHLWHSNEQESAQHRSRPCPESSSSSAAAAAAAGGASSGDGDSVSSLCSIADHRLYKIVKWCKSLPLFKSIQIDDQISLLINTWCELLLFACCFRSVPTPGEIRISHDKRITLEQARAHGIGSCIERMIHFTDHLRRLRVDQFEYAAMKVIILLSSDTSGLKESESVRSSQESVLKALQEYTLSHYPDVPSKFGELLLRIPELERTCQVGKDMLAVKREGDGQGFNLLMELLRGDH